MKNGILWFDDSKTALNVKLEKAIGYYVKKYGRNPDLILMHPSMLEDQRSMEVEHNNKKVTVRAYRPVLPSHIWIGIEDKD